MAKKSVFSSVTSMTSISSILVLAFVSISLKTEARTIKPPAQKPGNSAGNSSPSGDAIQVCFSPNESCDQTLIRFINGTSSTLDIAIYSITHPGISQAITAAKNRGVKVRMIVDRSEAKGTHSETQNLISSGVDLKVGNFQGIMHDKFTISDGKFLETGSFNYTENATHSNAENQMYLSNAAAIQRYQSNFEDMWSNALSN